VKIIYISSLSLTIFRKIKYLTINTKYHLNMVDSVSKYCLHHGIDNSDAAVFTVLVSNTAVEKIWTTEQLVKKRTPCCNYQHQDAPILWNNVHSKQMSSIEFFDSFGVLIESKYNVTLMEKDQYIAILNCLRVCEVAGRCGDDDTDGTWFQKKNQ